MIKQEATWVFWDDYKLINSEYLRNCLDNGWIVVKSDLLHDKNYPDTIVYILEKEFDDNDK